MGETQKKILIIDDEIDLCMLMRNYLVNRNYEVAYAHTLADGLHLMLQLRPDILFLDNNLPDGTGWSHLPEFFHLNPELRLYLMSGYHPVVPEYPGMHIHVIPKPISFADLANLF